jgi:DNA repair exonuclease SbcCD ATPase subunit
MNKIQQFIKLLILSGINNTGDYEYINSDKYGYIYIKNKINGFIYKLHTSRKFPLQKVDDVVSDVISSNLIVDDSLDIDYSSEKISDDNLEIYRQKLDEIKEQMKKEKELRKDDISDGLFELEESKEEIKNREQKLKDIENELSTNSKNSEDRLKEEIEILKKQQLDSLKKAMEKMENEKNGIVEEYEEIIKINEKKPKPTKPKTKPKPTKIKK